MINKTFLLLPVLIILSGAQKVEREALPREIFRDDVEPKRGGKVPEAAKTSQRIELNKLDAVGLDRNAEVQQEQSFFNPNSIGGDEFFQAPFSSFEDDYYSDLPYNPVFDPVKISGSSEPSQLQLSKYTNPYAAIYDSLFEKPKKKPVKKSSKDTYKYIDIEESNPAPPKVSYNDYYNPPEDSYYAPAPAYEPAPYEPAPYEPAPYEPSPYEPAPYKPDPYEPAYNPPPYEPAYEPDPYNPAPYEPAYEPDPYEPDPYKPDPYKPDPYKPDPYKPAYEPPKPTGPVLLEKRPYEVKSVQPLPITVAETYTNFDCRSVHPGRHYADPEAGCEVYHFCHHDGKQDTFHCGYGTIFNEYIGTCDYKNNVHCEAGEGYIPPIPQPSGYHPPPPEPHYQPHHKPHHLQKPSFQKPEFDNQFNFDEEIKPFTNFNPF